MPGAQRARAFGKQVAVVTVEDTPKPTTDVGLKQFALDDRFNTAPHSRPVLLTVRAIENDRRPHQVVVTAAFSHKK
jgi:hypothetical protein